LEIRTIGNRNEYLKRFFGTIGNKRKNEIDGTNEF